jgi:hypothetical protein
MRIPLTTTVKLFIIKQKTLWTGQNLLILRVITRILPNIYQLNREGINIPSPLKTPVIWKWTNKTQNSESCCSLLLIIARIAQTFPFLWNLKRISKSKNSNRVIPTSTSVKSQAKAAFYRKTSKKTWISTLSRPKGRKAAWLKIKDS